MASQHEPDQQEIAALMEQWRHLEPSELRRRLNEGALTPAERAAVGRLLEEEDKVTQLPAANEWPPSAA